MNCVCVFVCLVVHSIFIVTLDQVNGKTGLLVQASLVVHVLRIVLIKAYKIVAACLRFGLNCTNFQSDNYFVCHLGQYTRVSITSYILYLGMLILGVMMIKYGQL